MNKQFIDIVFTPDLHFLSPVILDDLFRMGTHGDGGYVLPKSLVQESDFLLSFGVNDDWNFESDFQKIVPGAKIHAYDHTISKKRFLAELKKNIKRILTGRFSHFNSLKKSYRNYLNYKNFFKDNVTHFKQRVHNRIESPEDTTVEKIFNQINSKKILLKMDIEGSEYRVIPDLLKFSDSLTGLIIEFHDIYPYKAVFIDSIKMIQENYFIAHLHANNHSFLSSDNIPEALEITFVRKDFLPTEINYRKFLPLESLDIPCKPNSADYRISFS